MYRKTVGRRSWRVQKLGIVELVLLCALYHVAGTPCRRMQRAAAVSSYMAACAVRTCGCPWRRWPAVQQSRVMQ